MEGRAGTADTIAELPEVAFTGGEETCRKIGGYHRHEETIENPTTM